MAIRPAFPRPSIRDLALGARRLKVSPNLQISETTYLVRETNLVASEIDGEIVILDMASAEYFSLMGAGAFLWRELETSKSVGELVDQTQKHFSIDRATCSADVMVFAKDLVAKGLLRIVGQV